MGKLAELLAGCPRAGTPWEKPGEWKTIRAFPGFMAHRLYILLSRPKEAISEFGAGDYKTPLFFFLFFTIILAFLQNLASQLQWAVFVLFGPPAVFKPGFADVLGIIFSPSVLIIAPIERTVYAILFLGISTIILALCLWLITGIRSWNPAFTICAYSLPVPLFLGTVLAFVQVPRLIPGILSQYVALAFVLAGIIFTVFIAGYGIQALTKKPLITSVMVALFWAVIGSLVIGGMLELVILPLENGLRNMIAVTFFPQSYSTVAAVGT
ncbi:MAG: hypothetical protein CVV30_12625 [Methanomicrobiales archaeon HGW-Methanomicrobiales-1]|jgi:hypothetical protein|nr:MAG: hypothetical protein CVV30_12625 [Methanomicrobiales archaeon HGW-Methanomicrobiales-1]